MFLGIIYDHIGGQPHIIFYIGHLAGNLLCQAFDAFRLLLDLLGLPREFFRFHILFGEGFPCDSFSLLFLLLSFDDYSRHHPRIPKTIFSSSCLHFLFWAL